MMMDWSVGHASVASADIVTVNVGGKLFTTNRRTLCLIEGSLLACMFSGRWDDSLQRDTNGSIFLNFDPDEVRVSYSN